MACCSFNAHAVQLYELETAYLSAEHSQCGTVLKVWKANHAYIMGPQCSRTICLTACRLSATRQRAIGQGYEGFLSSKDALRKRNRQLKPEDRSFSLCSVTSQAVRCPLLLGMLAL